jgi:hypothetical protein
MQTAATTPRAPQHLEALARANQVRLARAALKRAIARGELAVADVVDDVPAEAETMTVFDLLASQRRWGDTRCKRLLRTIPISETKAVGTLTDRQRDALVAALAERGATPAATPALALA